MLRQLDGADAAARAWALWRTAGSHRIRGVSRQVRKRNEQTRKKLLEEAESLLEARLRNGPGDAGPGDADPGDAESWLVLSQVYQSRITGMVSGMRFGRRASETLDKALELDPENPRILYLKGVSLLMAPGPFGDREEALRHLARAVSRFRAESGSASAAISWGEPEAFAFLGLAHAREDDPVRAREHYERALALAPEFAWVRNRLLPDLPPP